MFAYFNGDNGERDVTRLVSEWRLEDEIRWAVVSGSISTFTDIVLLDAPLYTPRTGLTSW